MVGRLLLPIHKNHCQIQYFHNTILSELVLERQLFPTNKLSDLELLLRNMLLLELMGDYRTEKIQ